MNSTRRPFLQKAALSIVAANFPFSAFCQKLLKSQTKDFDPETLVIFHGVSRQTFEPWIGSRFSVSQNNKSQGSLVLMSVDESTLRGRKHPTVPTLLQGSEPFPGLQRRRRSTAPIGRRRGWPAFHLRSLPRERGCEWEVDSS